jgi:hypothetical protein
MRAEVKLLFASGGAGEEERWNDGDRHNGRGRNGLRTNFQG